MTSRATRFSISAPLLGWLFRRSPGEIARRAAGFRIDSMAERAFVDALGRAFLGGYNAMLARRTLQEVAQEGAAIPPHVRPFFFEGAAMGYLPRGYLAPGCTIDRAETDLLAMEPRFRYLYYVGLGFWFGVRPRLSPSKERGLDELATASASVSSLYAPLCFDGFGFKTGFFDYPARPGATRSFLAAAPDGSRASLHQGFGRALHFVFMDDEAAFQAERARHDPPQRRDLETGRSLALAFTRIDRPAAIAAHLASAADPEDRLDRMLGVTWALTARAMTDGAYFETCLGGGPPAVAELLRRLPPLCEAARERAHSYAEWQALTRAELSRLDFEPRSAFTG